MIWQNQSRPGSIPVSQAVETLRVSRSGYYKWLKRQGKDPQATRDRPIIEEIMKIVAEYQGYGYRRVTRELQRRGHLVNHKRVLRLMRENGVVIRHKKWSPITTDSAHDNPVYPNLVRGMTITGPNQVWASDLTYIKLRDGFVYLAVELDIHTRRCLGWALSRRLDTENVLDALYMALYTRRNDSISGLIHHSDRGTQYTSYKFTECLRDHGIQISNSRKGNPYDNAFVESFFKFSLRNRTWDYGHPAFLRLPHVNDDHLPSLPQGDQLCR